jgi:dTDP-4-amino-4,6-dideoxygalactose transaminase
LARNILSLPIYPGMALEAVRQVAEELLEPAHVG